MSEHVSDRKLKAFTTGALPEAERRQVDAHLRTCSICRDRMLDESAPVYDEDRLPRRLQYIIVSAVLLLVIASAAGIFAWVRGSFSAGDRTSSTASYAQPVMSLRDGGGYLTLTADGRVDATFPIPVTSQKPLTESLVNRRIKVPKQIADLPKGYPESAPRVPGEMRLLAPIGTAVLSTRPQMTWQSIPDASSYTVTISRDGKPVVVSPNLIDSQWEPPALEEGTLYTWSATAEHNGQHVTAAVPGGPAAFFVLDANRARELQEFAQLHTSDHALVAVAMGNAGVIDKAEAELRNLIRNNPGTPALREILANLRPGVDNR